MHGVATRRPANIAALVAVLVGGAFMAWIWGFMVDDALIVTRMAWNVGHGSGYRFNADGEVVDAVTPLGFAHLLALVPAASPPDLYVAAKWVGAACWAVALAGLAHFAARAGKSWLRFTPVALACLSAPAGAWAVSGLETGVVTLLTTAALMPRLWSPLCAGLAAAWRPELLPWAAVLAVGTAWADSRSRLQGAGALAAALAPAVVVAVVRALAFGHPAPLAVFVKPSDLGHGVFYVTAGLLWTGLPWLLVGPNTWRVLARRERAIAVALLAHLMTLVAVGGDWMPLFRLFVPMFPSMLVLATGTLERGGRWLSAIRLLLASAAVALIVADRGLVARAVGPQREQLIEAARPSLRSSRRVATVDAGWVALATDAHIVDLSGATREEVALLGGGHTSKRLPPGFLDRQAVDTLILLVAGAPNERDWVQSAFARQVELTAVAQTRGSQFVPVADLPLVGSDLHYLIVRRREVAIR